MELQAGCNSLPVVKPTSRGASQSMIRCNSEADSKVWMEEVILKLVIHNVIIVEWMAGLNVDTGSEMNYYLRCFLIVRVRIWL